MKAAVLAVLLGTISGCEGPPERRPVRHDPPRGSHVEEIDPADMVEAPAVADTTPPSVEAEDEPEIARPILHALSPDTEYASDDPVSARRYVYRLELRLHGATEIDRSHVGSSAAELFVDVSHDRLRARFVGPGWPVEAGSELRLRADSPGAYIFDRSGGRTLAPGEMTAWFEGGFRTRTWPVLAIRRDPPRPQRRGAPPPVQPPGALVCAMLAEWANEPRENVIRRCAGGPPIGFRVGFWYADRTADVPVELPRRALRADEQDPPPPVVPASSRAFFEPSALGRVPPMPRPPHDLPRQEPSPPGEGLDFVNESDARVVVTVEGIAIGWVDAGASGLFVGLRPGVYHVAALRPLGAVVIQPRIVVLPGRTVLRAAHRAEEEAP